MSHNYADHIREAGIAPPTFPTIFNKQSTRVMRCDRVEAQANQHTVVCDGGVQPGAEFGTRWGRLSADAS